MWVLFVLILMVQFVLRLPYSVSALFTANTHLYFKPDADHIRLLQTITCLSYLENKLELIQTQNPSKAVTLLFCGDFNCTPPFSSCRLAITGKVTASDEDWTSRKNARITNSSFPINYF